MQGLTTAKVDKILHREFKENISNLYQVKIEDEAEVYRFEVEAKELFLRITPITNPRFSEKWILEKSLSKKAKVPSPILISKVKVEDIEYSYIVFSSILGNSIDYRTDINRDKKKLILHQAGADLCKINSIKTSQFGWNDPILSAKENIFTGYDESIETMFGSAINESIPFLESRKYINTNESQKLQKYILNKKKLFKLQTGFLAHGDFNESHIFSQNDEFTGIIDFASCLSTDPIWDISNFYIENKEDFEELYEGWRNEVEKFSQWQVLASYNIHKRIVFYSLIITLTRLIWIIENSSKKMDIYTNHLRCVLEEINI